MAVIAWLHCAWQGQGARLTSQKAAAPAPTPRILVPSCSLHRLHGLHRSHGLHRMALIAWLAWQGEGARLTSQKAAAPAPTPRILVPSCALHRSHGLDRMALIAWLYRAWQGQGARLTIARRLRPRHPRTYPCPKLLTSSSCPSSHGPHRMLHCAWQGQGCSVD